MSANNSLVKLTLRAVRDMPHAAAAAQQQQLQLCTTKFRYSCAPW